MNQLNWIPETKEESLEKEVRRLSEQCERIRKGQFAKLGAITKVCNELQCKLEILESHICKNNLFTR